eukprot:1137145-Alexandrium_andersonii.AAC.1
MYCAYVGWVPLFATGGLECRRRLSPKVSARLSPDEGAAEVSGLGGGPAGAGHEVPVSYTHLTLPTICSV